MSFGLGGLWSRWAVADSSFGSHVTYFHKCFRLEWTFKKRIGTSSMYGREDISAMGELEILPLSIHRPASDRIRAYSESSWIVGS